MARPLFIAKRSFSLAVKAWAKGCARFSKNLFSLIFAKRQILFVTNQKINTINLGPIAQICLMIAISWIISLFYSSIQYNKILSEKSEEISRLETITSYYNTEFDNINEKLNKTSDYMSSMIPVKTQDNQKPKKEAPKEAKADQSFKIPKTIQAIKISDYEQGVLEKLKTASLQMNKITKLTDYRLEKIETILAVTGLKIKDSDLNIASAYDQIKQNSDDYATGGPYVPLQNYSAQELAMKNLSDFKLLDTAKFVDKIERLLSLERMARFIPFERPMKKKFISSNFGPRVDPMNKKMAMHQGVDFVGSKNQEILSPSIGTVVRAGKFYEYGNAVVIDHGYGITTRYGHLSKVLVKKGQLVKKGDILGLQGSTGRSTGDHLHYEVRYKNNPLNPYKFIKAGDSFFKDNKFKAALELEGVNQTI